MKHSAPAISLALSFVVVGYCWAAGAQSLGASNVVELEHWVHAVQHHVPGQADESVGAVRSLTPESRTQLTKALPLFFSVLLEFSTKKQPVIRTAEERRVGELADDAGQPGVNNFLERAAVLHTDVAVLGGLGEYGDVAALAAGRPPTTPALASAGGLVLAGDGEALGGLESNWNWTFARSLLDLVVPKPGAEPFVALWYHATSAHMLKLRLWGEAGTHLQRAATLFPDDASTLFDRGCLAEALGLSESQQLLTDEDRAAMRIQAQPGWRAPPAGPKLSSIGGRAGIPLPEVTNGEAERLFRRALALNPSLLEARVRLARLLEVRGRHSDAEAELSSALASLEVLDPIVGYYAHLFAARADQALGQPESAAAQLREALTLFPRAQSALLAASQLSLLRGNADEAFALLRPLVGPPADSVGNDPWWAYDTGSGRQANELMTSMWNQARVLMR